MKSFIIVCFFFILMISCKKENYKGHWHEFKNENLENCIIIDDSVFCVNKNTNGGCFQIQKKENLKDYFHIINSDTLAFENPVFYDDKIIFDESIVWLKQENNSKTFLKDFSAGLKVNINPIIKDLDSKDTIANYEENFTSYIFIGYPKESFLSDKVFKNEFYLQLNETLTQDLNDIVSFISCYHCDLHYENTVFVVDENTINKSFLDTLSKKASLINYPTKNFYFQYVDTIKNQIGYLPFKRIKNIIEN